MIKESSYDFQEMYRNAILHTSKPSKWILTVPYVMHADQSYDTTCTVKDFEFYTMHLMVKGLPSESSLGCSQSERGPYFQEI